MKFVRLSFLPALIILLISFASCDKTNPPEPSIEEAQLALLSKTWTVSEVRFGDGNTDLTSEFNGMTLTISGTFNSASGTQYDYSRSTITRANCPWPKTGTWSFDANDPEHIIIRQKDENGVVENIPVTYSVTANQLQLIFNYLGAGYAGRVSVVEGDWTFLFTSN